MERKEGSLLELLQLKYFCDAAKTENFSKTAKKYDVPPSNISQSIRRLETELGRSLFDRSANRIRLNAAGKLFCEKASFALSLLEKGKRELQEEKQKETLSICINSNRRIVMQAVERFQKEWPNVSILTRFLVDAAEEDFDLVISVPDEQLNHLFSQKITEEVLAIAVKKDLPYANSIASLSQCRKLPFITMGSETSHHRLTTSLCEENGFFPRIAIQSDDPFYIRKCVELGLGIAVVPTLSWKGLFSDEVKLISLEGKKRSTFLYSKKTATAATEKMIAFLLEEFRTEEEQK